MLNRRIQVHRTVTYADLHEWLRPGALLEDPPTSWLSDWIDADSSRF
ncbi:hypothetical protein G4X40_19650 [Rhodococcus sp. D2-41]|nr:hypothetical protein [Rhodococcus sp. D2-41]MDG3012358.1 hypothetical protein [Rhodococcus sp. D2-41]